MEQENKHLPTAWTPSETGLKTHDFTEKVVLATKEVKLMYVKDIRSEWKKLLAKLNILLGGSNENLPSNEELEVMLNYALDNWYKLTLQEIELAVVANISHKTDEVVKFFGKISVSYLQSCITNYETVRRKAILDHKRREEAMKPRTHPEEPDHVRNAKLWAGLVQFTVKNNRSPNYGIGSGAMITLKRRKERIGYLWKKKNRYGRASTTASPERSTKQRRKRLRYPNYGNCLTTT